jgi:hypothetical protein
MTDLSAFPITQRWPAQHPDRLQLYSLPTPNGVKVSIMLEEIGLPYEPHTIDIGQNETWTPEFLSLNPNGKIPAIIDPDGPGGKPIGLFESGAILVYLAEKTGKFLPKDPARATRPWPGCSSRWPPSVRCSARSVSSTSSPAASTRTSVRATATSPNPSACWACWRPGWPIATGSWATTTRSPTSPPWAGCATWSASTARASWSTTPASSTCRPGWSGAWPVRPSSAGWRSPSVPGNTQVAYPLSSSGAASSPTQGRQESA